MNRSEAEALHHQLDIAIAALEQCKCAIGPVPDEGNCEWMQDEVLSRLTEVDSCIKEIQDLYKTEKCTYPLCMYCNHVIKRDGVMICRNANSNNWGRVIMELGAEE